jgi:hypothetical protein
MKKLLFILFALVMGISTSHAQFGTLGKLYKTAKSAAAKNKKQAQDDYGNKKIIDILKASAIDTTSVEYKEAMERSKQEFFNDNPQLKKMMELQDDTVALKKYMQEQYGGMTEEEMVKKMMGDAKLDIDSKEFEDAQEKAQKMQGLGEDPLFKKIMAEGRTLTKKEAEYFHEKYGADFEYDGMEEYNDSIGVYAQLNGRLKPMSITMYNKISDERPVLDLGQNVIKGYVKDFMGFLKKPFGDREVVDSVQDYLIYNHLHAEEQFKGVAKFTIYSNKELDFELSYTLELFFSMKVIINQVILNAINHFPIPKWLFQKAHEIFHITFDYILPQIQHRTFVANFIIHGNTHRFQSAV